MSENKIDKAIEELYAKCEEVVDAPSLPKGYECVCGVAFRGGVHADTCGVYNKRKSAMASINRVVGIGGAPTRATTFPPTSQGRKSCPVASGFLDYFPDAVVAVSHVSWLCNEQHHPGEPINWERGKSTDEADAMMRHFMQRGALDEDGARHSAKMAWRALALLQKEIERDQKDGR